jgi:hypothetical protein
MAFDHAIWLLGKGKEAPKALEAGRLTNEQTLEDAIEGVPSILNDGWMIIGRQVLTDFGKRIDLLALDAAGTVIVIELKRDQTPRDVVAQVLEYGAWVNTIPPERLAQVYAEYASGRQGVPDTLDGAFQARFGVPLPDAEEASHQLVVVASALDAGTERIVNYLAESDIPINVVFFRVFEHEGRTFLSRVWLRDPVESQSQATTSKRSPREPWNGEYYASFGHDQRRRWEDARRYGFISAGGGQWFSRTLGMLSPGDRVWVNVPQTGYVAVGIVEEPMVKISEFRVRAEDGREVPIKDMPLEGPGILGEMNDEEKSEYIVRVRWLHARALDEAVKERGLFGNQNSVCQPRTQKWIHTVQRLKQRFGITEE